MRAMAQPRRASLDHGARHRRDRAAACEPCAKLPPAVAEADVAGVELDSFLTPRRDRLPAQLQVDRKMIREGVGQVFAAPCGLKACRLRHQKPKRTSVSDDGAGRKLPIGRSFRSYSEEMTNAFAPIRKTLAHPGLVGGQNLDVAARARGRPALIKCCTVDHIVRAPSQDCVGRVVYTAADQRAPRVAVNSSCIAAGVPTKPLSASARRSRTSAETRPSGSSARQAASRCRRA